MSDNAGVKKKNLNQVRRILWQGGQYTKLDISRATGLSVATSNTLLNELEKAGEVVGQSQRTRDVGRSSIVYHYNEEGHAALGEILADELGGAAPGHDVDVVHGPLAIGGLEIPLARDGKAADREARLGVTQLGIAGQTTHYSDVVQHGCFLLHLFEYCGYP